MGPQKYQTHSRFDHISDDHISSLHCTELKHAGCPWANTFLPSSFLPCQYFGQLFQTSLSRPLRRRRFFSIQICFLLALLSLSPFQRSAGRQCLCQFEVSGVISPAQRERVQWGSVILVSIPECPELENSIVMPPWRK